MLKTQLNLNLRLSILLPVGYIKMEKINPLRILVVGFLLVLFGVAVPLLTVIQLIEASFFWLFLSFTASVAGVLLGVIGAAYYTRFNRK